MVDIIDDGDEYISAFERRLWNFTYTVLYRYKCPIQFQFQGPNVDNKMNQMITFYVPEGREDVASYIIQEWKDDEIESLEENGHWFWGVEIDIMYFSGPSVYADKKILKEMTKNILSYSKDKVDDSKKDSLH